MYIITSKSNSSFGTTAKATGVKMTAKVVGKNSSFCLSVKNNLNYYTLNSLKPRANVESKAQGKRRILVEFNSSNLFILK